MINCERVMANRCAMPRMLRIPRSAAPDWMRGKRTEGACRLICVARRAARILNLLAAALFAVVQMSGCGVERRDVDVLVIGASTSGTAAAIAAARQGVTTLVVEPTPMLGGMLSAQGVSATDGNAYLPSGLWNEFREAVRRHYGGAQAVATGWVSTTLFEPHVADSIFRAMAAAEPSLEVLCGYRLAGVLQSGGRVRGATFVDAQGRRLQVAARVTIDATDLGDALPMSGTPYRLGMDARSETGEALAPEQANDVVQDMTVVAILKDYGPGADRTIPRPAGYDPAEFAEACRTATGTPITPEYMLNYGRMPNGKYMINWPIHGNDYYLNVVELPFEERFEAVRPAREKTLRFVYYIQHELGFRHLGIADDEFGTDDGLAYLPYHREGRRLDGVVRLTLDDVADRYNRPAPLYRTGISVGDYPVDHHHDCYPGIGKIPFPAVPSFSIPAGVMIPATTENLIVADKAISVSNLINGSTRLQPVVLLTGQAAGTLAALAVERGCTPREVPVRALQRALLAQKAYLAPLYDVAPDDPDFELLQRIAVTGILRMRGESYHWSNRSWFDPGQTLSVGEFAAGLHEYAPQVEPSGDGAPLTAGVAAELLRRAGGEVPADLVPDAAALLTRREAARMVDQALHPFDRDVDFEGRLIE